MNDIPAPKMTPCLTKAEALSHAAALLREQVSGLKLVKIIADVTKKSDATATMPADFHQFLREMPELEIQIKAREGAAAMIEALLIEERILSAKLTPQES